MLFLNIHRLTLPQHRPFAFQVNLSSNSDLRLISRRKTLFDDHVLPSQQAQHVRDVQGIQCCQCAGACQAAVWMRTGLCFCIGTVVSAQLEAQAGTGRLLRQLRWHRNAASGRTALHFDFRFQVLIWALSLQVK